MGNTPRRKSKGGTRTAASRPRTAAPQKSQTNWPRILTYVGGGALVAVLLWGVLAGGGDEDLPDGAPDGVELIAITEANHVVGDIDYGVVVPAGGDHNVDVQPCGFYDGFVRPENVLHALEHGAVWASYRRDLGTEAIDGLEGLLRGRRELLVSEMPDQPAPLILTAWGAQLEMQTYDDTIVRQFYREFNDGVFAPEPGASC